MKKIVSVVLALMLITGTMSALGETAFTPAESYDVGVRAYNAGTLVMTKSEAGEAGTVSTDVYPGKEGADYTDEKHYTYHSAIANIGSSMNWDVLSWETSDDDNLRSYLVSTFYSFVPNTDVTGYSIVPELAAALPQDVTSEYVGSYGVEEGETGKAWRIVLRNDATFNDGTPITADTAVYSMQQQLNPKMLNRRADSWYDGSFSIVNAKNYLYAGGTVYNACTGDEDASEVYADVWNLWGAEGYTDAEGNECPQYVPVTDETEYNNEAGDDAFSAAMLYENYFADYCSDYFYTAATAEVVTWEDVGFKKVDDYTIDFILEAPVSEPAFYVPYMLSDFMVEESVYEACKTFYDADGKEVATEEEADTITTSYNRSLETTVSYGPYMLASFELDKEYSLVRNENWYGWSDNNHVGQYQTDEIVYTVMVEHSTEVLAFEKGEIDDVSLTAADMDKYASSSYIMYEPQSYTTKLTFNTDYDKLVSHGTNSQVVMVDEFRKAFAFCIDRQAYVTANTAAGTVGLGMLNYMYCYDPFTGALYRDSEGAKAALCHTYNVTYGEGGDYETLDEAYAAITGYDMTTAQELMKVAYEKAVSAGIYDGESDIVIDFRMYQSTPEYVQMFNFFNESLQTACVGSGFEGKVSLKMTEDADYYNTMYSGNTDMIFSTWGGSQMDPFSVLAQCYCDASDGSGNQMEIGYDTEAIALTFDVEGIGEVTASLHAWANWANNATDDSVADIATVLGKYADYDYATRCAVFAGIEECYLSYYVTTPVYYRNVASLHSQKVNNLTDTYMTVIGFGGLQFLTYNYDDTEWAEYIAANELVY